MDSPGFDQHKPEISLFHRVWRRLAPRHFENSILKKMTGFEIHATGTGYERALQLASVIRVQSGLPVRVIQAEWFEMGGGNWPLDDETTGHVTNFSGGVLGSSTRSIQISIDEGIIITPTAIWKGDKFQLINGDLTPPQKVISVSEES
ncbi:hypothetical protein N9S00_08095 [Luminiphilus sp.]|nr:hypothetical protein [Luminiphilus sp.]